MKRVLRSCFEPLPRVMSTKSLTALVALLLVGTAISVIEYLESARAVARHTPRDRGTCQAAEKRDEAEPQRESPSACVREGAFERSTSYAAPSNASTAGAAAEPSASRACARSETEVITAPPFAFDPKASSVGG